MSTTAVASITETYSVVDIENVMRRFTGDLLMIAVSSGFYIVPLYYAPEQWIAYSVKLGRPETTPLFGVETSTWWRREP